VRRAVLVDTGPLYAAVDPSDQHHQRAQTELARAGKEAYTVLVAYPLLLESYTLVRRRLGTAVAWRFLEEILATGQPLNPEPPDYRGAVARVRTFHDQPITLFDAVLAELSERLGLPVWTYDHHFDVMRVTVWR
jgi:predicted nucleic acid-binding protein